MLTGLSSIPHIHQINNVAAGDSRRGGELDEMVVEFGDYVR